MAQTAPSTDKIQAMIKKARDAHATGHFFNLSKGATLSISNAPNYFKSLMGEKVPDEKKAHNATFVYDLGARVAGYRDDVISYMPHGLGINPENFMTMENINHPQVQAVFRQLVEQYKHVQEAARKANADKAPTLTESLAKIGELIAMSKAIRTGHKVATVGTAPAVPRDATARQKLEAAAHMEPGFCYNVTEYVAGSGRDGAARGIHRRKTPGPTAGNVHLSSINISCDIGGEHQLATFLRDAGVPDNAAANLIAEFTRLSHGRVKRTAPQRKNPVKQETYQGSLPPGYPAPPAAGSYPITFPTFGQGNVSSFGGAPAATFNPGSFNPQQGASFNPSYPAVHQPGRFGLVA
jgi:hypothetical protein